MLSANIKWTGTARTKPHPMHDGRRVPVKMLMQKLDIMKYDAPAPWWNIAVTPRQLILPLKQAAGVPNKPIVKKGDEITVGQPLGEISDKDLGAIIHAPIAGIVAEVTDDLIILTRQA
jgi:hypothetical protein